MKKLNFKRITGRTFVAVCAMLALAVTAFAEGTNFDPVVNPIVDLIDAMLVPALAIVGALGSLFCIILGVKFAKAEEPQEREKAKTHLKNAIIGFVLIFVLILAMNLMMPILKDWVSSNGGPSLGETATTATTAPSLN